MTFRSAILDKRVRISSWMPSAKYALALSSLKFSNGITAMLFSGIAAAAGAAWSSSGLCFRYGSHWCCLRYLCLPEFLWHFRVTQFIRVEVYDVDAHIMLHLAFPQVVQMGTPLAILFQVVSHMLGQKNVPSVPAIHHSLRQVDSRARYIGAIVHIGNSAHRSAVDSHAHPQLRLAPQRFAHSQCTGNWRVRCGRKNQRHSIAGWQASQVASSIGGTERIRFPNNLVERVQ